MGFNSNGEGGKEQSKISECLLYIRRCALSFETGSYSIACSGVGHAVTPGSGFEESCLSLLCAGVTSMSHRGCAFADHPASL